MIVAVTGGTGFIGRKLVLRHLARRDNVRVLSRRAPSEAGLPDAVDIHRGDLAGKIENLQSFVGGVDVLYHCAGELRDSSCMHAIHVAGTQKLVDAAAGQVGHWVQLSSVGAYGPISWGVITEATPENPFGAYEVTKTESDRLVSAAAASGAFSCTILRPANVFGPSMPNRSLFSMVAMIERGLFFFIGKPGASANYIHVDNVVEGLVLCGSKPAAKGRVYNLSDFLTIEEFVTVIANALGKAPPSMRLPEAPMRFATRLVGKLPGFPLSESRINALVNRSVYSIMRIQHELGYMHPVSMEKCLRQFVTEWKRAV